MTTDEHQAIEDAISAFIAIRELKFRQWKIVSIEAPDRSGNSQHVVVNFSDSPEQIEEIVKANPDQADQMRDFLTPGWDAQLTIRDGKVTSVNWIGIDLC